MLSGVQGGYCAYLSRRVALVGILVIMVIPLAVLAGAAQTNSPTLSGEFANPPITARPQVRFWTPAAAVSESGLRRDVDFLARAGFGGVEVVGFNAPAGVDNEFAWGTEAWNRLMNIATTEAGMNGITVDFANGPRWPIAMPGIKSADDPGSLYELTYGTAVIQPGQSFAGVVPPRRRIRPEGTTKLIAVLAYPMTADRVLDQSGLVDLTKRVSIDPTDNSKSTVEFTAPAGTSPWRKMETWPSRDKSGAWARSLRGAKAAELSA